MKKKILNILVLLTIFALMISPVMAIDEPGLHFGEDSENIEFENVGFFDSFFSIFTDEGTYEPGDTSTFIVQSTSWNLHCTSSWVVVELYDNNGDFIESDSERVGEIQGNTYVEKNVNIQLSSRSEPGTYTAVEYLWCSSDDTSYDGVDHDQSLISTATQVNFQVDDPEQDCEYTSTGDTGERGCSDDRVQKLVVTSTSACTAQWQDLATCDLTCSAGACIDGDCLTNSDCEDDEYCDAYQCLTLGSTGAGSDTTGGSSAIEVDDESREESTQLLGLSNVQLGMIAGLLLLVGLVFWIFRGKK